MRLLPEVHELARAYHWNEDEILGLPLHRRGRYLRLIEAERDAALTAALLGGS